MKAYYNEIDAKAAAWLRELIKAGLIADGDVDERSIVDVSANDLEGYTQCHFFAGIGGWSYALRLAGWSDDHPVWTGSCPCQPFSCAGRGRGTEDPRHLWPQFRRLISESRPAVCFGEQVASKAGRLWLAGVRADLEDLGYSVGAADLCAAGAGAPGIRQRLFWVADAGRTRVRRSAGCPEEESRRSQRPSSGCSIAVGLADANGRKSGHRGLQRGGQHGQQSTDGGTGGLEHASGGGSAARISESGQREERDAEKLDDASCRERFNGRRQTADGRRLVRLVYAQQPGLEGQPRDEHDGQESRWVIEDADGSTPAPGPACFWGTCEIIHCTDGSARRVEPGVFPLADGVPGRVGLLRGYGNAIVPQVAAEFVKAFMECANPKLQ